MFHNASNSVFVTCLPLFLSALHLHTTQGQHCSGPSSGTGDHKPHLHTKGFFWQSPEPKKRVGGPPGGGLKPWIPGVVRRVGFHWHMHHASRRKQAEQRHCHPKDDPGVLSKGDTHDCLLARRVLSAPRAALRCGHFGDSTCKHGAHLAHPPRSPIACPLTLFLV